MMSLVAPLFAIGLARLSAVTSGITFEQAIGLAQSSPEVRGTEDAARVHRESAKRVSRVPLNPQLTVQPGFRIAPQPSRDYELVIEAVQPVTLSGHSASRRRTLSIESRELESRARATALSRRLDAARAWVDLWAAEQTLSYANQERSLAAEILILVEKLVSAESATLADLADARAFASEAALLAVAADGVAHDRGLALARELADLRGEPLVTSGELPRVTLPAPETWKSLRARAEHLPDAVAAQLSSQAAAARAVEERAARASLLYLGVGVQRDAPSGLVVSGIVRLTPAIFDRGEREGSPLAAEAARLAGLAEQMRINAAVEVAMVFHEVEHTAEVLDELEHKLVPSAVHSAALRQKIFRAGEGTLPEALNAMRTAIAARTRLERARADNAWARLRAWLLVSQLESPR